MGSKTNLANIKQQINFASNFAKNLQFKSNTKKPTSLLNRNERDNGIKKSLLPSPSQNIMAHHQFEERKRSNSVQSSGSIISTASSNSPKLNGDGKRANKSSSLQVAGMQLGSQRRNHIPSKFDKSPFIRAGDILSSGAPGSGGPGRISN